ncbi:MAG: hypothetical protein M3Q22_08945 [Actinomycetota bacterium]|nr:hypothetical protein [Actinomycetota bacterium]
MTTLPDTWAAVLARIEAMGWNVNDYDVFEIIDALLGRGTDVDDVIDDDFLKLLTQYAARTRPTYRARPGASTGRVTGSSRRTT